LAAIEANGDFSPTNLLVGVSTARLGEDESPFAVHSVEGSQRATVVSEKLANLDIDRGTRLQIGVLASVAEFAPAPVGSKLHHEPVFVVSIAGHLEPTIGVDRVRLNLDPWS